MAYPLPGILPLLPLALLLSLPQLLPPAGLGGLDAAVDLLAEAITRGQRILVVGDFDADGATSCALCLRALRGLGAADVCYLTAKEAGFDLLRDGLCLEADDRVHRPFHYVIVDEADRVANTLASEGISETRVIID